MRYNSGNDRGFLLQNTLFRVGGAAILLSNKVRTATTTTTIITTTTATTFISTTSYHQQHPHYHRYQFICSSISHQQSHYE